MKRIPLKMIRKNLKKIPTYDMPDGFTIRLFEDNDEENWARVEASVDEFPTEKEALAHFEKEFGPYREEMKQRCLFVENDEGEIIGTTSAWYGDLYDNGKEIGRIHWVAIIPDYQGRKLSKPLLSKALELIASYHDEVYLTSQTTSYQAVNMYLNYGFEPYITNDTDQEAWELLEEVLDRKILI